MEEFKGNTSPLRANRIMGTTTKLSWPRRSNKEGWSFPGGQDISQPHVLLENLKMQKASDHSSSNETSSVDHF